MLPDIAIDIRNVTKTYKGLHGPITALNSVNATILNGETVGVVGRNGCGKSTLLKIIGGIVKPTIGEVQLCGSILPITDVGAGMHPELTGTENIYMIGGLFGLKKNEIDRLIEPVQEFGGLDGFMDEPVKNYSQGMFLRLAFSLLAHLPVNIILLDEVLAVGDESFQQKCREKITEWKNEGKTILLVSHNFDEVAAICNRVLLLHDGQLIGFDTPENVYNNYTRIIAAAHHLSEVADNSSFRYLKDGYLKVNKVIIQNAEAPSAPIVFSQPIQITIEWEKFIAEGGIYFDIQCTDKLNRPIWHSSNFYGQNPELEPGPNFGRTGNFIERCTIPAYFMNYGGFQIWIFATYHLNHANHYSLIKTEHPFPLHILIDEQTEKANYWFNSEAPIRTNLIRWQLVTNN